MPKKFNALVKLKDRRGDGWSTHGEMDCYKGKIALVVSKNWNDYRLIFLPFINNLSPYEYETAMQWVFRSEDFEQIEYHCAHCGKPLKIISGMTVPILCDECLKKEEEESVMLFPTCVPEEVLGQNDFYFKNLVTTSRLLNDEQKNTILTKLENLERCADCGRLIFFGAPYRDTEDRPICATCRSNYFYCENCERLIRVGEEVVGASGRYYCCTECQEKDDPYDFSRELAYNAKPPVKFLDGKYDEKELYLGVEVEVDGGDDEETKENCIYRIFETSSDVYCKHDGSLNCGFEFVTYPATLNYHKNKLIYDDIIKQCIEYGFNGDLYSTTGLHIHASKSFFEGKHDEAALKLEILFERFWKQFLMLSNRTEERAARWAKRRNLINNFLYGSVKEDNLKELTPFMYDDRYTAINVTNKPTIEFRLFNGTTRKHNIFAMLELVDYLCRFVKKENIRTIQKISWEELFQEVYTNDNYKNLKEWMIILRLLEPTIAA